MCIYTFWNTDDRTDMDCYTSDISENLTDESVYQTITLTTRICLN